MQKKVATATISVGLVLVLIGFIVGIISLNQKTYATRTQADYFVLQPGSNRLIETNASEETTTLTVYASANNTLLIDVIYNGTPFFRSWETTGGTRNYLLPNGGTWVVKIQNKSPTNNSNGMYTITLKDLQKQITWPYQWLRLPLFGLGAVSISLTIPAYYLDKSGKLFSDKRKRGLQKQIPAYFLDESGTQLTIKKTGKSRDHMIWLIPFVIISLAATISAAYILTLLDQIVHGQLYNYGLQFSSEWANPYWTLLRIILVLLGVTITFTVVGAIFIFWKPIHTKRPNLKVPNQKPHMFGPLPTRTVGIIGILAVFFILLIFSYQIAGFALRTNTPWIVTSGASMEPAIQKGDLVLIGGSEPQNLVDGDIILFNKITQKPGEEPASTISTPVLHRITGRLNIDDHWYYQTKGDNGEPDEWYASDEGVMGKALFILPKVGYVVLALEKMEVKIGLIAFIVLVFFALPTEKPNNKPNKQKKEEAAILKKFSSEPKTGSSISNVTRRILEAWRRGKKSHVALITLIVLFTYTFSPAVSVTQTQASKKLEIIILENGIYDSPEVIAAITGYAESVKSSAGFDYSIVRLPQLDNDPRGIDAYIESRYLTGTQLFLLVGNDLRWPLSYFWDDTSGYGFAAPADGVLSDTDGELEIKDDGLHQPIADFTAEATVSYIFPPRFLQTPETQRGHVIRAFNKFQQFHEGKLEYNRRGIISGRLGQALFRYPADYMSAASSLLFGYENTLKQELSSSEVKQYVSEAPAFFGSAGDGSPQVVDTSSTGGQLGYWDLNDANSPKTPLLLEIFGCWTNGWGMGGANDPWSGIPGFLSEAAVFENDYTIAMIAGTPESSYEASFSNSVLSQMPQYPEATIGELMIGQRRRSEDWTLFGDPTLRFRDIRGISVVNQPPSAVIDYISPASAEKGTNVYFMGHGTDGDGTITNYSWRSDLDGQLSLSASFSTPNLSVGTHNIYFKVQDNNGQWSQETNRQITITPPADVTIISPSDGASVTGKITIYATSTLNNIIGFNFYIDGAYRGYDKTTPYEYLWDTMLYSNGQHKIYAAAYTNYPVRTVTSRTLTVTVNNPLPTVTITLPTDGSTITGTTNVEVTASNSAQISQVRFYLDGMLMNYDYVSPFQWSWDARLYANGAHTLRAEAYYTNLYRFISSQQITVSVNNQQTTGARSVTISSPSNGSTVTGTVTISVDATGDKLQRVYLYVDGNYMGYDALSPYLFSLNTAYLSEGPHQIYAIGLYEELPPHVQIKSETIILMVNNAA